MINAELAVSQLRTVAVLNIALCPIGLYNKQVCDKRFRGV